MSKVRWIGLDVHAATIAVAVAKPDGEVRALEVIPNQADSLQARDCSSPCPACSSTGHATSSALVYNWFFRVGLGRRSAVWRRSGTSRASQSTAQDYAPRLRYAARLPVQMGEYARESYVLASRRSGICGDCSPTAGYWWIANFAVSRERCLQSTYSWADNSNSWAYTRRHRKRAMPNTSLIVHRDPEILGGTPVFVGTRVPVKSLYDHLEAGDSLDEFLDSFPSVSRQQAVAALELAREMTEAHVAAAR